MSNYGEDWMEIGDLIPVNEDRWLDSNTGYTIDAEGNVYNDEGELIDNNYYKDEE